MNHFILTGAPGAGKTTVLRQLEVLGYPVVEEAATDVIALAQAQGFTEPHTDAGFIDDIISLQDRRRAAVHTEQGAVVFHDRSPICTLALAEFLNFAVSARLARSLDAIERTGFYERRVFFVRNLGFITNTEARRISFEDTLRFERVHEDTYRRLGFDLVFIEPATVLDRARAIIDNAVRTR